jgi:threonine dehydratase
VGKAEVVGTTGRDGLDGYLAAHGRDISAARTRLAGRVRRTPLLETEAGLVKPESLQVTGSFKARGALNTVLLLHERPGATTGVATASSGNHGRALAWAAGQVGLPAVVVMAADSNPAKVASVRRLGAEVVIDGVTMANREEVLAEVVDRTGFLPVHPFDDWDVIHGQATVGAEVVEDLPEVETVVVPVGGGGLISGTALAVKAHNRAVTVVGVEPAAADDATRSFREGRRVERAATPTLADGARAAAVGRRGYEVMFERGLVDDMVTVSEKELEAATRMAWLDLHLLVEPTGALTLAAALFRRIAVSDRTVLVLSGGNIEPALLGRLGGA